MPGFPLAAIGAGLGQFANYMQQERAQRERQQMLAITLERFRQEQQDRQGQRELANLDFGNLSNADSGGAPVGVPQSGGFPGGGSVPSAAPQRPMGGGMRAGGGLSIEALTDAALKAGFAPDKASIMAAITMPESGGNPNAYNPKDPHGGSFGVAQINGVHPGARDTMGNVPLSMQKAYEISKGGADFSPWSAYTSGAYRSYLPAGGTGQGRTPPSMAPQMQTGVGGGRPGAAPNVPGVHDSFGNPELQSGAAQSAPAGPQMAQAGPQTATDAGPQGDLAAAEQAELAKIPMPKAGGLDLTSMLQQIRQRAPNATIQQVQQYVRNIAAQRGPDVARQFEIEMKQHDEQRATVTKKYEQMRSQQEWDRQHGIERSEKLEDRGSTGGQIRSTPGGGLAVVNPNAPERGVVPIPGSEGLRREESGTPKVGKNIEVTDAEGKVVFSGLAHLGPEGWIADRDQKPVEMPDRGNVRMGGTAALPAEVKYPDKWEGMPNKPPPGVRPDVWLPTLEYIRTGKMPAIGFQAGMRTNILAAAPAAAHALGVDPAKVADLQAQYAGERHAEIVGGGRAAAIGLGIEEAKKAAPQVIATSRSVPRTQFPPINQFTNWLQEKSGSPDVIAFKEALNTYLNIYAATVSRTGRLTDSQQKHAYDLLSTNFNQGQIDRGIEQLDYEMSLMKEAVPPAMEELQKLGQPPALRQPETPAMSPQERARSQGGRSIVIQNGMRFDEKTGEYLGQVQQ